MGVETGAAASGDCNSPRRRQKLTQHMFVVGDYLSEQASVGLSQKVVKRRHVSRAEAALFASTRSSLLGSENTVVF